MKVAEWIARRPARLATVAPDTPLAELADRLVAEPGLRDLYVVDEGGLVVGHISYRRVARLVLAEYRRAHSRRQLVERVAGGVARELMDRDFARARPDEELDNVVHRLLERDLDDLAVIRPDGTPAGAVRLSDLLPRPPES
jgi:CBS domain-containing protein